MRLLLLFLVISPLVFANGEGIYMKENGDGWDLVTPWGKKMIVGEYAPDGNSSFRIEMPLEELKPESVRQAELQRQQRQPSSAPNESTAGQPLTLQPIVVNNTTQQPEPNRSSPLEVKWPEKFKMEYDDSDRFVVEANRLYNRGKFYESLQMVEELLRKNPDHLRGWVMKGSLLTMLKQKDLAAKAWRQALELDPQNQEVQAIVKRLK